jgi:hypothetical protein
MQRDARLLKGKAVASLRRCARAFNDFDDDGRFSTVLLHLQHAFEMLLKAALVEKKVRVFDKRQGRSIGFEKCVSVGGERLKLNAEQLGLLRAIDALRDDEQHYLGELNEGLLYLHVRAGVTLFGDILSGNSAKTLRTIFPIGSYQSPRTRRPTSTFSSTSSTPRSRGCFSQGRDAARKQERRSGRCSRWRRTSRKTCSLPRRM